MTLDPAIIEQIKREEMERAERERSRPFLELPVPMPQQKPKEEPASGGTVIYIQL
jgi:hypothetical protein